MEPKERLYNTPQDQDDPCLRNLFGFNWRIGRSWGIAHPQDQCYCTKETIEICSDPEWAHEYGFPMVTLGIEKRDAHIEINPEESAKYYPYGVGYLSTKETIKYGSVECKFRLPKGYNLWPAIWLTDGKTWPPEIDIMEAWSSGDRSNPPTYKRNHWINRIFVSLHMGRSSAEHHGKSFRCFRGTPAKYLDEMGINTCKLVWTAGGISVRYNGHLVAYETDPEVLRWFNESDGMEIHLNNYVNNSFRDEDLVDHPLFGYFHIYDLKYNPHDFNHGVTIWERIKWKLFWRS